jgi:phosphate transport system permease protein
MSVRLAPPAPRLRAFIARSGKRAGTTADRLGDGALRALCTLAALLAVLALAAIAYEVFNGASLAYGRFGLGFLFDTTWAPNFEKFGAGVLLFGTVVTSAIAILFAIPLGVAIALFLSMVAPGRVRSIVGPMVEMLAAIPSVILGFWGILVLAPFLPKHLEPLLHSVLGFLPIFGPAQTTGASLFTAGLILTIMVLPIVASISRDLFLTVPQEMKDGAIALGSTKWEVVRGVVLPSTASGVLAASFLGLGRALGEAIAVAQVIGGGKQILTSFFTPGDTLASKIAIEASGTINKLQTSALFYCGAILLVIGLLVNLTAQVITRRFEVHRAAAR